MLSANEYQKRAMRTLNPELSKFEGMLIDGALGLAGEAGEVVDLIKKWYAQGHDLKRDLILEELGDVCWAVAEVAMALDIDFEEIMQVNLKKIEKRYPDGFEVERSIERG